MNDLLKSKAQLIAELQALRQQVDTSLTRQAEGAPPDVLEQIERAKQEWEITVDSLPELICLLDRQGRVIRANRTLEHWRVGQVTDIQGREIQQLFPRWADFWSQAWAEVVQGRPVAREIEDEEWKRCLHVELQPVVSETKWRNRAAASFAAVIISDITARKWAEKSLQEAHDELETRVQERTAELVEVNKALYQSEQRYKQLLEAVTDYVFTVQVEEGRPAATTHGPGCVAVTGYTPPEYAADPFLWRQMIYEADRATVDEHVARVLAGETVPALEHRLIHKDGTVRWVRNTSVARIDEHGQVIAYDGLITDITERKQLEERLKAVYQLGQELALLHDETLIARRVLEMASEVLRFEYAGCALIDEATDELKCLHHIVSGEPKISEGYVAVTGQDACTIGKAVVRSGQALNVPDIRHAPQYVSPSGWEESRSALCVPMRVRQRIIGILNAQSINLNHFTPADQQLLQTLADQTASAIENARLYQAERTRYKEAEALRQIALVLTSPMNLEQVIERILVELQNVVPYDSASVQMLQEGAMKVIGGRGFPNLPDLLGYPYPVSGDAPNALVLESSEPVIIDDVTIAYPAFFTREPQAATKIRGWLGVPLRRGEGIIGMLTLDKQQPGFYNQAHARLAAAYAAQAAIAIENAQLFELLEQEIIERQRAEDEIRAFSKNLEQRVADRTRELSALYDITAVASESLDLEATLERLLERFLAAMRSKAGAIHTLDEAGEILQLAVQQGLPADIAFQEIPLSLNDGLFSWVIEHGEPLLLPNLAEEPPVFRVIRNHGFQSCMVVPMRTGGQLLGVLSVFGEASQQFSIEEVALLTSIGDQVGVVIENARLHQRTEQTAVMEERARLARELHDSVTQSLYSLTLLAGGGQRLARDGSLEDTEAYLADLGGIAQQALKEMRLLIHQLQPTVLEQEGLVGALQQRLDAVEKRSGLETRLLVEGVFDLPPLVEREFYRIIQEALNNTLKHAVATLVTIHLRSEGEKIVLEVIDNGQGFAPETASETGGMGLMNMQERLEKLNGSLTILSSPGQGTRVTAVVPNPNFS